MTKLTSKPILKKASGILAQEFAIPKDIAWAWVTLLLSQEEQKRDSEEKGSVVLTPSPQISY